MSIQKYKTLDLRYASILVAVVEGYINTCQPISSNMFRIIYLQIYLAQLLEMLCHV